ncbi:MAG: ISL3 family transposase [Firmicutes bacterium]|nr:ISL3 family transposase [Candidatus Colivicinus equi]
MNNLIKSLFNIDNDEIDKIYTVNDDNGLVVHIRLKRKNCFICPVCGRKLVGNGYKNKPINHKALVDRNTSLIYEANRYRCKGCNYTEFEKNPFAIKGFNNSILVVNQVMIDLHDYRLNYTMIAQKNNISVTQVVKYLDSYVVIPHIALPVNLGIDEIHSDMAKRKNASYLCTLTDNDNFKLIDILTSRSKYELSLFFEKCPKEERESVKYVTIDMWEPYKNVVLKWLPNATIAVDPFHVIEHLSNGFTKVRIKIMNSKVYGSHSYYLLKHWHKLLESDKYNLNNEPKYNHVFKCKLNYTDLLKMLLELDEELTLAYELKESYRNFNSYSTYETASKDLDELIVTFKKANIKEYEEFINIMITWKQEIVNSFIISDVTGDRLSNAKSESMNRKIKLHISISNGLANFLRFRKRMLYCFNDNVFVVLTEKLTSMKRDLKQKLKEERNKKL